LAGRAVHALGRDVPELDDSSFGHHPGGRSHRMVETMVEPFRRSPWQLEGPSRLNRAHKAMILTASIGVRPFNLVEHTTGSGLPQHPSRDLAAVSRRVGSKGICLQSLVGCAPGFNIAKPLPRPIRGAFVVSRPPNSAAHSAAWVARYREIPMFACRHIWAIQSHGGPAYGPAAFAPPWTLRGGAFFWPSSLRQAAVA